MQVEKAGRRCGCGQHGCWEQYCSGRALLHEAREIADVQRGYGERLLELGNGRPEGIEAVEVTQAAREGDPAALDCFDEVGGWLGQGLADLAAVLDPGAFVIGGGVADAGELLLAPARRVFAERLTGTSTARTPRSGWPSSATRRARRRRRPGPVPLGDASGMARSGHGA